MVYLPRSCRVLLFVLVGCCFSQCGDGLPDDPYANFPKALDVDLTTGFSTIDLSTATANFNNFPFEVLSDQEEKGILFIREEEKLARDYFIQASDLWSLAILSQMGQNESNHYQVSGLAIDKYGLNDPSEGMMAGEFASNSLQAFYGKLIEQGSMSSLDGLLAATKLEEASLVTIQNQLDRVANNRDLRNIYMALRIATRNHLRIMVKSVGDNGGIYSPSFLDSVEFLEIVNSGFEV